MKVTFTGRIRDVILEMIKRRGLQRASKLTVLVSPDPNFLYRRGRHLTIDAVLTMLDGLGCNLADLASSLSLEPTGKSWRIVQQLEDSLRLDRGRHDRLFLSVLPKLDELRLSKPRVVLSILKRSIQRGTLSGHVALKAAFVLGPALRADENAPEAEAILNWVANSPSASRATRALALQRLAYAKSSTGRKRDALQISLEAQEFYRIEGNIHLAAQCEVDKSIFRHELGDLDAAYQGFSDALATGLLNDRNVASALSGLGNVSIDLEDASVASDAIEKLLTYHHTFSEVDLGRVHWTIGRLHLLQGEHDDAKEHLLKASQILASLKSEDALRAFVESMFLLGRSWNVHPDRFTQLAYQRAKSRRDIELVDELARIYLEGKLTVVRLREIQKRIGKPFTMNSTHCSPPVLEMGSSIIRRVLLTMARRSGLKNAAQLTSSVSPDPNYLYRYDRKLSVEAIASMLGEVGCSVADLVHELNLDPTFKDWVISNQLEIASQAESGRHNRAMRRALPLLEVIRIAHPRRVITTIRSALERGRISGDVALEAAVILGPALRADAQPHEAVAILSQVTHSSLASKTLQALALQRLAYAHASIGKTRFAFWNTLESQDIFRMAGNATKVAECNVDKGIILYQLGDLEPSFALFCEALESDLLNDRNIASALSGLTITAIDLRQPFAASQALAQLLRHQGNFTKADLGKIQWNIGRLHFALGQKRQAVKELLDSSRVLAESRSEDSLRVFVEMLCLIGDSWTVEPQKFTMLAYQRAKTPREVRLVDKMTRLYQSGQLSLSRLWEIQRSVGSPFTS